MTEPLSDERWEQIRAHARVINANAGLYGYYVADVATGFLALDAVLAGERAKVAELTAERRRYKDDRDDAWQALENGIDAGMASNSAAADLARLVAELQARLDRLQADWQSKDGAVPYGDLSSLYALLAEHGGASGDGQVAV